MVQSKTDISTNSHAELGVGTQVHTALGPITPAELGMTMMHEHFMSGEATPIRREKVIAEVKELRRHGVRSIVEASAMDMHRDPEFAKEMSRATGINAIMATGLYRDRDPNNDPFGFKARAKSGDSTVGEDMFATMIREVTEGIRDTGVRPGVIKVGTGHGEISSYEETVLKAAARVHMESGLPIITHTEAGTMAPEQAELLIAEGVDPQKLMVGHMDCNCDLQYHTRVLAQGCFISFDRMGFEGGNECLPEPLKKGTLIGLLGLGYVNQIMISQDYVPRWRLPAAYKGAKFVNWTFNRIFADTIPALKQAGVSDIQIYTMMADNPRRLFSGR